MDFQSLVDASGTPLYEIVARRAKEWNVHGNIGLVVGATYTEELKTIRQLCPEMPILIPGIGAQGGDLASTVKYGISARVEGLLSLFHGKSFTLLKERILLKLPGRKRRSCAIISMG